MGTSLILLRCTFPLYSFLGINLGNNPYLPLAVISAVIASVGLIHLLFLKRSAGLVWWQALIIVVIASGSFVLALVKSSQGGLTCIGIFNPPASLQNKVATDDALITILLVVATILAILLLENILVSFWQKQVRFLR